VAHVAQVAVHPERRGQGLAGKLLDRALALAHARGARAPRCSSRTAPRRAQRSTRGAASARAPGFLAARRELR
jgi:GNAT superfamily N-acetyltransferase